MMLTKTIFVLVVRFSDRLLSSESARVAFVSGTTGAAVFEQRRSSMVFRSSFGT
jgi:hypothetical protein